MTPEHADHDDLGHERRLAEALGALVQQADVSDYRDGLGHPLANNVAFRHAQAFVEEFGVTHEDICAVLDTCGGDETAASDQLIRRAREARPSDRPAEYRTWTTGP